MWAATLPLKLSVKSIQQPKAFDKEYPLPVSLQWASQENVTKRHLEHALAAGLTRGNTMFRITTMMLRCWAWFNSLALQAQQKVLGPPFRWLDQIGRARS